MKKKRILLIPLLLAALFAASGCASTQTLDNGVTIEKKRSGIPFVPFL
ncbi:MAG: hypothetical protein ACNA77_00675 [Opitutales bacterium]